MNPPPTAEEIIVAVARWYDVSPDAITATNLRRHTHHAGVVATLALRGQGRSYREIGAVMRCSAGAVMHRVHRASEEDHLMARAILDDLEKPTSTNEGTREEGQ